MKQILFSECIPNFLLYECFAMHTMTCQVLVLGQNTRGVTICPHRALPTPGGLPPSSPPVNFECPSPLFFALVDYPCMSWPWCRRAFLQGSRCHTGGHRWPSRDQSPSHTRIAHSHGHVMLGDTGPLPLVAHDCSSALPHEPRPGVCSRVLVNMCTHPWTHTHVASSFELSAKHTQDRT